MTEPRVHTGQAQAADAGQRLDQVAARQFPGYSRARLQKWIRDGALTVDGAPSKPSHKLAGGEHLRLEAVVELDVEVLPQDLPLDVVYEDGHLLVINKAAGVVVHPAAGNPDGTLQNALLHFDPQLAGLPRSGIVHRLDKDTTGLMVVARNLTAHARLVEQLQSRQVSRIYAAVVHGQAAGKGTVDEPIGRHPHDRKRMAVVAGGKAAVSHFRILGGFQHFSHLEVALESGRTHQIRVHMKHIGLPLVGDPTYGRKGPSGKELPLAVGSVVGAFPRQALHARRLSFSHPDTGKPASFSSVLPDDMTELIDVLEREDTM